MSALDLIRRGRSAFPRSKTGSGATNINGGVIHIDLDRVWLLDRLTMIITVTQGFTGVPTSYDVRRFFQQLQLIVDKGNGMKMNFHAAYDLARMTQLPPAPVVTLGAASSAVFVCDLYLKNNYAVAALSTALLSGKYSTLAIELTINPDANNGFIGGTVPQVAQYNVEVMPSELRDQTPANRADSSTGWGVAEHCPRQQASVPVTVNGLEYDCILTGGGKTRFVTMHCFDAANYGNLTDAPINNGGRITMEVDGFKYYDNTLLSAIKLKNIADRNMSGVGFLALDFGDDPNQWCDMRNAKDIKFHLSLPASANLPAAGRIEFCQDFTTGLEKLPASIRA